MKLKIHKVLIKCMIRFIKYYRYTYDVTHCMFSAGNITEKLRIASFDCSNETVVDMFAGELFRTGMA